MELVSIKRAYDMANETPDNTVSEHGHERKLTDLVRISIVVGTNNNADILTLKDRIQECLKAFTHHRMEVNITSGTHLPVAMQQG